MKGGDTFTYPNETYSFSIEGTRRDWVVDVRPSGVILMEDYSTLLSGTDTYTPPGGSSTSLRIVIDYHVNTTATWTGSEAGGHEFRFEVLRERHRQLRRRELLLLHQGREDLNPGG